MMKSIFLGSLLLFVSGISIAQIPILVLEHENEITADVDSIIGYRINPKTGIAELSDKEINEFDANGHQKSSIKSYWSEGGMFICKITYYKRDSTGKVIRESEFNCLNEKMDSLDKWAKKQLEVNVISAERLTDTYDAKGNRISHTDWGLDAGKWKKYLYTVWTYDAAGRITSEKMLGTRDEKWTYTYNTTGQLIKTVAQILNGKDWESSEQNTYTTYEYDDRGNLKTSLYYSKVKMKYEMTEQIDYTYDANNDKVAVFCKSKSRESGKLENRFIEEFTYDKNHNETSLNSKYWKDNDWVANRKVVKVFDENNIITYSKTEYFYNGNWINEGEFKNVVYKKK